MKKFTKICLVTSLVMILVGGSMVIVTLFKGGLHLVNYAAEDMRWLAWIEEKFDSPNSADITKEYLDTGISSSQIRDLKIEIGGASVYLTESDNDNFGVRIEGDENYEYAEENGVFCLQNRGTGFHAGGQPFTEDEKVYLYIPKGMRFQEADIVIGGGMAQIEMLEAEKVNLEVGAGAMISEMIKCRTMNVEVGAGKAILHGVETSEMDMEVGMGEASVAAVIADRIQTECGMGSISLKLGGTESDYNYNLSCSAGNINLNGKSYTGLAKEQYIHNNASAQCGLECAMGSIEVMFE